MNKQSKFDRFDALVGTVLSVSRDELKQREKEYQEQRKKKKRAKPASSRVLGASS